MPSRVKTGNYLVIAIALFIFIFIGIALNTVSPEPKAVLKIEDFSGNAEISFDGKTWRPPLTGSVLPAFDFARTGENSEIEFLYNDGAGVTLKSSSKMQFASASRYTSMTGRLHLIQGRLEINDRKEKIQISTALAGESASRGFWQDITQRFIHVGPGGSLRITVIPGEKSPAIQNVRGMVKIESLFPRYSETIEAKPADESVQNPA